MAFGLLGAGFARFGTGGAGDSAAVVGGAALLVGETNGLGIDFTCATDAQRVATVTAGVVASQGLDTFFTSTGTSPKQVFDVSGSLIWSPHNMFLNSGVPVTQTVTTVIGQNYTVTVTGSGSMTGSSGASGVATEGAPLTYTATGGASIFTKAGTVTQIQMNRGAVATAYIPTTAAIRNGLAIDYDPVTHACKGVLLEPAMTNLILNNAVMSTQSITVAATTYTLSFFGTGTITLSGVSTAGPLVGTGATDRVTLTFTPTAGSLTLTVTGTVNRAQIDQSAFTTSPIPTFASSATRAADQVSFLLSSIPSLGTDYSRYERAATQVVNNTRAPMALNDGTASESAIIRCNTTMNYLTADAGGTAANFSSVGSITSNAFYSVAARAKNLDYAMSLNGAAAVTNATGTMPTLTQANLGTSSTAAVLAVFWIAKLMLVAPGWEQCNSGYKERHMSLDFLFRALTRKDFEAMARTANFIDAANNPLPGIETDPAIGTPEYETGLPIVDVPSPDGVTPPTIKTGWHCNVRVSGEREQQEIEGLPQTDAEGNLLPAAERTHFGIAFSDAGTVWADAATEGLSYANVALINELTIVSAQRVWL